MKPFGRRKHGHAAGPEASVPKAPVPEAPPPAEPDIPVLKKKEEERKRGGALWSGSGASGGASGLGAAGVEVGAGAAARAGFLGSRAVAAALSKLLGGPGTVLGGLFAAKYGSSIVLGGMMLWAALVSLAGLAMLGGGRGTVESPAVSLSMGGSGIVIDSARDKALGMVARANEGEFAWDETKPTAPKVEEKKDAVQADGEQTPPMPDVSEMMKQQGIQGDKGALADGFTKRLAKGLPEGSMPSMMGSAGLAGGNKGLKQGAGGFNLKSNIGGKPAQGKLATFARGLLKPAVGKLSSLRGRSNRAMGQLKMARTMSSAGAAAAPDSQAHQYAANAFDQQGTQGGQISGIDDTSAVVPPSAGTGTGTGVDNTLPTVPEVPPGGNVTPYQPTLDAAKGMGNMASMLKLLSLVLIAAGIAIMAMASGPWAFILIMIGLMLVALGMMMLSMAGAMAGMAKNMGNMMKNMYGQQDQGQIVDECADQAYSKGTKIANCSPATQPEENKRNTSVQQAVQDESNATYQMDGGTQKVQTKGSNTQ
ncbi:MAG: hypothetical protein WC969_04925 [Elusimicrobiota bacterium]|jgi:hypothetical protein